MDEEAELPSAEGPNETYWRLPLALAAALAAEPTTPFGVRIRACAELVLHGRLADAEPSLRQLEARPGFAVRARQLRALGRYAERAIEGLDFAGARPADGGWETLDGGAPGASTEASGALLWLRPGTSRVVLAFSTLRGNFGMLKGWGSVFLVHRFLAAFPVNIVYLRDETACLSLAGNRAFGEDYGACVAGIRALCEARGWRDAWALGLSSGGFPALRYGLDLGLRGVLSFSGPTDLTPGPGLAKRHPDERALAEKAPHMAVDLLPLMRAAARRPRMLLCYGEGNAYDAAQAQRFAGLAETELVPFAGFAGHSTFMEAGRLGQLRALAARLIETAP